MVTWLIIGAARGIGFGFVQELAAKPENHVIAFIRSQSTAGELNKLAVQHRNIDVVEADLFNPESLKKAADEVTAKTDGKLDVLIHNAFSAGTEAMLYKPTEFTGREQELQNEISEAIKGNVLGPIYTINAFLPLLRNGTEKKIIYISTGAGDIEVIRVSGQPGQLGYASSKAAGNAVIAKYAAELADEGIKTLSLSPGWVNTDAAQMLQQNEVMFNYFLKSFQKVDPNLKGPISVQESVQAQLAVIAALDAATSGRFLTHRGDATSWF